MQTEIPLFASSGEFLGFYEAEDLRPYLRRGEAHLIRKGDQRKVILSGDEKPAKSRAISSQEATKALNTNQREPLYQGRVVKDQPHPIITSTITVLRKARGFEFKDWNDREKFKRRRFNPDRIAAPMFSTEREYREAVRA